MTRLLILCAAAALCGGLGPAHALAQSPRTGDTSRDRAGRYTITAVPPGSLTVPATMIGFAGKRWFDMVRRGPEYFLAAQSRDPTATDPQPTDMLWPVPQAQIDLNPQLTPNREQ